jgi:PEP-CTERM motif-containing protein
MIGNTISNNCYGAGREGSAVSDFGSIGFSGGDFTSVGYRGGGFNGLPPSQQVALTPEPSTIVLLFAGLTGLLVFVSRRQRLGLCVAPTPIPMPIFLA